MVDELRPWPGAKRPFHRGFCHLTATSVDELHDFAAKIGMKRSWFQTSNAGVPHYDLTEGRRRDAMANGAVFVSAKDQARMRIDTKARRISGEESL